jgi:NaMN:DMB phosphoribosyltransferase
VHEEGAIEVTGETTVAMVLSWGLTIEDIESVIGAAIEADINQEDMTIKALAETNGLSFGKVKTALNNKLSELSE